MKVLLTSTVDFAMDRLFLQFRTAFIMKILSEKIFTVGPFFLTIVGTLLQFTNLLTFIGSVSSVLVS